MTDRVHILGGDELDEELLAEALGRTGISDYCERGQDIYSEDVDFDNAVVDVPGGKAFVLDNGRDVMLLADPRAGVDLATDGTNHVYVYYDLNQPEGDRIGYHVSSDQTPPSFPSLRIAAIDMAAEEVDRQNQTAPIYRRDAETYKGNDIDTDGDGVVDVADNIATSSGQIGGDALVNTSEELGDTTISVGSDAGFALAGAMGSTPYFERTPGAVTVGSADETPTLGADLDGGGNDIGNLSTITLYSLALTNGTPNGLVGQSYPGAEVPGFVPKVDGDLKNAEQFRYDIGSREWTFGPSGFLRVPGGITASNITAGGDVEIGDELDVGGLSNFGGNIVARNQTIIGDVLRPTRGDGDSLALVRAGSPSDAAALLAPIIDQATNRQRALVFNVPEDRWVFRDSADVRVESLLSASNIHGTDVSVGDELDVGGIADFTGTVNASDSDRLQLPARTSDPSNASAGAVWFREDL